MIREVGLVVDRDRELVLVTDDIACRVPGGRRERGLRAGRLLLLSGEREKQRGKVHGHVCAVSGDFDQSPIRLTGIPSCRAFRYRFGR